MESSQVPSRVLVVAHKTAATQPLLDAVAERAARGPAAFTLLVPNVTHGLHKVVDAQDVDAGEAQAVLDTACRSSARPPADPSRAGSATRTRSPPCTTRSTSSASTR
jgi:hypothetical protein